MARRLKIARGSEFEGFKDNGCIAEVHKPILAQAHGYKRPAKIPAGAVAIAGSGKGDYRPLFLWLSARWSRMPARLPAAGGIKMASRPERTGSVRGRWDGAPVERTLRSTPC